MNRIDRSVSACAHGRLPSLLKSLSHSGLALSALVLCSAGSQAAPNLTGFTMTFNEEFTTMPTMNSYNNWSTTSAKFFAHIPYDQRGYGFAWWGGVSSPPFSISNGILDITAHYDSSRANWRSGALSTAEPDGSGFKQQYGYFEARMKFPPGSFHFPAFWLMTDGNLNGDLRKWAEVDIVEFNSEEPTTAKMNVHSWDPRTPIVGYPTPARSQSNVTINNMNSEFHTYGVLITPEYITWYIDGVERRENQTFTEAHEAFYMLVTYALNKVLPDHSQQHHTYVDYIRAYSLPASWPAAMPTGSTNLARKLDPDSITVSSNDSTKSLSVDGISDTRWGSAYSHNQYYQVDLGHVFPISRVKINWETAYGKAYKIQGSLDGTTWTDLFHETNGNGGIDDITGLNGNARYIRMQGITRGTRWGYSFWEFEVYSKELAQGKPAYASSQSSSTYSPAKAVDGNMSTRWSSAHTDDHWIYVDLGQSYPVSRVTLNWETAYAKEYKIQISDNATTWNDIYYTTVGDGATDTLTGLKGTGRYLRVQCIKRATHWGNSLWDLQVYP